MDGKKKRVFEHQEKSGKRLRKAASKSNGITRSNDALKGIHATTIDTGNLHVVMKEQKKKMDYEMQKDLKTSIDKETSRRLDLHNDAAGLQMVGSVNTAPVDVSCTGGSFTNEKKRYYQFGKMISTEKVR